MKVIHFEIPAQQPERLKSFYAKIFDWKFCQWDNVGFWVALTGQPSAFGIDGGIIDRNEMDIPLLSVVEVDDIDEICNKIISKGGIITVPKFHVPGVGFLAYFKDLDNNTLGLKQVDPTV